MGKNGKGEKEKEKRKGGKEEKRKGGKRLQRREKNQTTVPEVDTPCCCEFHASPECSFARSAKNGGASLILLVGLSFQSSGVCGMCVCVGGEGGGSWGLLRGSSSLGTSAVCK